MPLSVRSHELIQKYIEGLASETELAELEGLLANDPEFAVAFAEAARLEANLKAFFQKQYKIDQVAALLNAPEPAPPPTGEQPAAKSGDASPASMPTESSLPKGSLFVLQILGSRACREWVAHEMAADPMPSRSCWKWIAAAVLLLASGIAFWSSRSPEDQRLRLLSGRVTVAGREVAALSENVLFEVVGPERAVIQLPGGARIEFTRSTRALIRRDVNQSVVRLDSGGGEFRALPHQTGFRVETLLGVVTKADGRFTLDLVTTLPEQFSPTEVIPLPRLTIVVAQGTVIFEHAGTTTTLSAGEERVFINAI